jgi:hypothetical protein
MVFNAIFNNISVISELSVLLVEETWSTRTKPPTCRKLPIWRGFASGFVNDKKGALDWQSQVIKLTSGLSIVGDYLRVLQLLPPPKLVAMI